MQNIIGERVTLRMGLTKEGFLQTGGSNQREFFVRRRGLSIIRPPLLQEVMTHRHQGPEGIILAPGIMMDTCVPAMPLAKGTCAWVVTITTGSNGQARRAIDVTKMIAGTRLTNGTAETPATVTIDGHLPERITRTTATVHRFAVDQRRIGITLRRKGGNPLQYLILFPQDRLLGRHSSREGRIPQRNTSKYLINLRIIS
jgi:hypothetical protein